MDRRRFLAALAGSAAGLRAADNKPGLLLPTDQPDQYGFRIMWYNPVRPIDPGTYRLRIRGLAERPRGFSLADLRRFPQETQNSRMKCVQCWSSRATWGGFRFGHLLEAVKPLKTARAVRFDCADKWYEYMSIQELLSPRVLVALQLEGQPLPARHGAPLRLIDPSRYGYKSAKLITSMTFVSEGKGSMACDLGPYYSPGGEILPGYDQPLDLGPKVRKRIPGGEITNY